MQRKTIRIKSPKVLRAGDRAILRTEIEEDGTIKPLSFSVDGKYEAYLTWERSDAFVVALLYYAMINDRDIEWEMPCSEQLIYQLETFFIPVYANEMAFMHMIGLHGPTTTALLPCENGVATGISNGVDSCYTLRKYTEIAYEDCRLTHVVFTDWFLFDSSEEYRKKYVEMYLERLPDCAKELGLELIYISLDVDERFSIGHFRDKRCGLIQDAGLNTLKYCAGAFALQKLLKKYYFSNTFVPSDFSLHKPDVAYHDVFTLSLITTDTLRFYSSGMEVSRVEKTAAIADWPYAQRHLQVCMFGSESNCGRCSKCIRTMSELYAAGKLEQYDGIFPVEDYKRHLPRRLASVMAEAKLGHAFERDIVVKLREKKIGGGDTYPERAPHSALHGQGNREVAPAHGEVRQMDLSEVTSGSAPLRASNGRTRMNGREAMQGAARSLMKSIPARARRC